MLLRLDFVRWRKNMERKRRARSQLPLGALFAGELCLYQSKIPEAMGSFSRSWRSIRGMRLRTILADAYSRVQKYDDAEKLLQRSIWLDATHRGRIF